MTTAQLRDKPFPEAMIDRREDLRLSQREVARRTQKHSGWGSSVGISSIETGKMAPSRRSMEIIARALEVDPSTFAEYRMAVLRDELNPARVGFDRALRALRQLEG